MSPPLDTRAGDPVGPVPAAGTVAVTVVDAARAVAGYLTFWTAVCLPVLLVALLVAGIETVDGAAAFLALTGVEICALVLGRRHPPGHRGDRR